MDQCDFCAIAAGEADAGLVAFRNGHVFVIPALRQRALNRGHALVLPVAHVRNLQDAPPELLSEVFAVTARLTGAVAALYGADGSTVFQNNTSPDDLLFHLHVHVVPRFTDDHFAMPDPAVAEVPWADRERQAAAMRQVLAGPAAS